MPSVFRVKLLIGMNTAHVDFPMTRSQPMFSSREAMAWEAHSITPLSIGACRLFQFAVSPCYLIIP